MNSIYTYPSFGKKISNAKCIAKEIARKAKAVKNYKPPKKSKPKKPPRRHDQVEHNNGAMGPIKRAQELGIRISELPGREINTKGQGRTPKSMRAHNAASRTRLRRLQDDAQRRAEAEKLGLDPKATFEDIVQAGKGQAGTRFNMVA